MCLFLCGGVVKPFVNEPEAVHITIFYSGQVIVFIDLPTHKAREIIALSSNETSHSHIPNFINNVVQPIEKTIVKDSLSRFVERCGSLEGYSKDVGVVLELYMALQS
ncbi:hypothetical protein ACFE04_006615 [Oxalis oulophora]